MILGRDEALMKAVRADGHDRGSTIRITPTKVNRGGMDLADEE
jgi:hypothetical protein